jgi:hypothetical protein
VADQVSEDIRYVVGSWPRASHFQGAENDTLGVMDTPNELQCFRGIDEVKTCWYKNGGFGWGTQHWRRERPPRR